MKFLHSKLIGLVLVVAGLLLLGGGLYGFASLAGASHTYERVTGVVERVRSERVYRHRKVRTDWEMEISYPTSRFGELHTAVEPFLPFWQKGDHLQVLYHPDKPREIRLPGNEYPIWGLLVAGGLGCLAVAWLLCRKPEQRRAR